VLFLSITDPQLLSQPLPLTDGIELRLDKFPSIDLPLLQRYIQTSPHKIMLTLRELPLSPALISLSPHFIDLRVESISEQTQDLMRSYPHIQWILSYHNFSETPDLEPIYNKMIQTPASGYKIATMCNSSLDALRLLIFAKTHPHVSAICMGEKGAFGRILGPIVGNQLNYAAFSKEQKAAPGQYTVEELSQIYHFSSLNQETAIYALIGSPVTLSPGHIYHNNVFKTKNLNAVYVKIDLSQEELPLAIPLMKQLPFKGLSVTMPLKETILPFVDTIDSITQTIGAVNTLRFEQTRISGTNTDYTGALAALQAKTSLAGKKVVILGAGGAARAIVYALKQAQAEVWVLNRTLDKAKALAEQFQCFFGALPKKYDILIHCGMPIEEKKILPGTLAMDVVHTPKETSFLKIARERGCEIIYGEDMFVSQAAKQTKFWIEPCKH